MSDVLEIFLCISAISFVVLVVFLIRLSISAYKLTRNADDIAQSIQKEIEPTLKELKEAAKSINSIAASADTQIQNTKEGLANLAGTTNNLSNKLKGFATGILKGVAFGLSLFKK